MRTIPSYTRQVTPAEFLAMPDSERRQAVKVEIVPPQPGIPGWGGFLLTYRLPFHRLPMRKGSDNGPRR